MAMMLRNIMHAGGGIDGFKYTNSAESILLSLANNERLIELDCIKIRDSYVLAHDGTELRFYNHAGHFKDISFDDYRNLRVHGKYTPMTFEMLAEIMSTHPEATFIIDAKMEGDRYTAFLKFMAERFPHVLARLCMQVYKLQDVESACRYKVNKCMIALWKYYDKAPFSEDAISFVVAASRVDMDVIGISLRYENPETKEVNLHSPRLDALRNSGHTLYIHGQEVLLSLYKQALLNTQFSFFTAVSYNSLPVDFDWRAYTSMYQDLSTFGELQAKCHFLDRGVRENRRHRFDVPVDFDWRTYAALNPDLRLRNEFYGLAHYTKHGSHECRRYK
jgi:hypothetical protein